MISTPTLPFVFSFIKDHLRHSMYVKYKGLLSFKEHKDSVYTSSSLKKYMHVNINTLAFLKSSYLSIPVCPTLLD